MWYTVGVRELDMEIFLQGVIKVNYETVIDEDVFNECCKEAGLDPANFNKFTNDDWDELNPRLAKAVPDNESKIDYTEIVSASVDTLTIDQTTTVYYGQNRKVCLVEIL